MGNSNSKLETINGIPIVEGTHVTYWGPPRGDVYNGRHGIVSVVYPGETIVMVIWEKIPNRDVQTTISVVSTEHLLSNELVAFDGSRLVEGTRVVFRGREDSDIPRGRCGRVLGVIPECNLAMVRWDEVPNCDCFISHSNHNAQDLVAGKVG